MKSEEKAKLQEVRCAIRNNLGMLQRLAGIFSRRGIAIKAMRFTEREEAGGREGAHHHGILDLYVAFEGDDDTRKAVELQIGKMADFVSLND